MMRRLCHAGRWGRIAGLEEGVIPKRVRDAPTKDADEWPWSSYAARDGRQTPIVLSDGPVKLPANWGELVHRELREKELESLRNCIARGAPLGDERWVERTAAKLNLESTMRPRGRPWKKAK
jgi:putative transposase